MLRCVTILLFAFVVSYQALAQGSNQLDKNRYDVKNTEAILLGQTAPVHELQKRSATSSKLKSRLKKNKLVPNFQGRGKSKVTKPELEHQGIDKLRQRSFDKVRQVSVQPSVNIDGLSSLDGRPLDPTGAAGNNLYVQAINATVIGVYSNDGTLLSTFTGNSLWQPLGQTSAGDPIILYDSELERWLITEFTAPGTNRLLIAASTTSDPLGSYNVYSFLAPDFPDYPKYAIWSDLIVVTTNEGSPGTLHQYFIDRAAIMAGASNVDIQRVEINGNLNTEAGFFVSTPVNWIDGPVPADDRPMVVRLNDSSWGDASEDQLEVFTFDIDFLDPANTIIEITPLITTPYDGFPCSTLTGGFACVPQAGGGNGIDAIPEVIMNVPQYRNFLSHESIVLNFITDVTNGDNLSGIRWMELRRVSGSDWTIFQEGTFAPNDGLHRYMGSIAIDGEGNIALGYNVSSSDDFVGVRFTGRTNGDPLGQMTVEEFNVVDGQSAVIGERFGDYSQMTVDPLDELTFWFTTEYAAAGGVATRIVSFQLDRRDNDLSVVRLISPTSGSLTDSEIVTVEVSNPGNNLVNGYDLQLMLGDEVIEVLTIDEALSVGQTAEHSFTNTLDLSQFGTFEITINAIFAEDEFTDNNILTTSIDHVANVDASVSLSFADTNLCGSEATGNLIISNEGMENLTSISLELLVNDVIQEVINFDGLLEPGNSTELSLDFEALSLGENQVAVNLINPNGQLDELPEDNLAEAVLNVDINLDQVTLILTVDNFPEETSWNITNSSGDEVASSEGNLGAVADGTTLEELICLPTNECYTLTIFDTVGDGICCGFGLGSYSLIGPDGEELIASTGEFDFSEGNMFCLSRSAGDFDVSIAFSPVDTEVCSSDFSNEIIVSNNGLMDVNNVSYRLFTNGIPGPLLTTGPVNSGGDISIPSSFTLNQEQENILIAEIESIDGNDTDLDISNNTDTLFLEDNFAEVSITIMTDESPEETFLAIVDPEGQVLFSFSELTTPNNSMTETVCLPIDSCYNFLIFDSSGNGGPSYVLSDENGNELLSSDGVFGEADFGFFCLGDASDPTVGLNLELSGLPVLCDSNSTTELMMTNNGEIGIQEVLFELSVNGLVHDTITVGGNFFLPVDQSIQFNVDIEGLAISEVNDIDITTIAINGLTGINVNGDSLSFVLERDPSLAPLKVNLITDTFPSETSWQILDEDENIVASATSDLFAPFDTINQNICLEPGFGYDFVIFDSFGDGICCDGGEGSYTLFGPFSDVLGTGGDFEFSDTVSFFLGRSITASLEVSDEIGEELGSISVVTSDSDNVNFSIDGGESFQSNPVFENLDAGPYEVVISALDIADFTIVGQVGLECLLSIDSIGTQMTADNRGIVHAFASSGRDMEFSIDGGITFQSSGIFTDLESATYELVVNSNGGGCSLSQTVLLEVNCDLVVEDIATTSASETNGGVIDIVATSSVEDIEYSIDNGITFQPEAIFEDLNAGEFNIVVRSNDGICVIDNLTATVREAVVLSTSGDLTTETQVYPNPTEDGVFRLLVSGLDDLTGFLDIQITDFNGKILHQRSLGRYDGVFEGVISLAAYPSGIYFIRFTNTRERNIVKVVKK